MNASSRDGIDPCAPLLETVFQSPHGTAVHWVPNGPGCRFALRLPLELLTRRPKPQVFRALRARVLCAEQAGEQHLRTIKTEQRTSRSRFFTLKYLKSVLKHEGGPSSFGCPNPRASSHRSTGSLQQVRLVGLLSHFLYWKLFGHLQELDTGRRSHKMLTIHPLNINQATLVYDY